MAWSSYEVREAATAVGPAANTNFTTALGRKASAEAKRAASGRAGE
jgi:hypothetical protein